MRPSVLTITIAAAAASANNFPNGFLILTFVHHLARLMTSKTSLIVTTPTTLLVDCSTTVT